MRKTRFLLFGIIFALSLSLFLEKNIVRGGSSRSSPPKNLHLLKGVIHYIKNDYLEEKDPLSIIEGSFRGLVNSLDSYSGYLNKESTARYLSQREARVSEPGLILFKRYGSFPQVVGLIEGSPAEKSGLHWGDLVTEIGGLSTPAMSLAEINLYLKATEEVPLSLKILREERTLPVKVDRVMLATSPLTFSAREGFSGILKISRLTPPCVNLVKAKLVAALKRRTKPLIIDLRNCQEGTFEEARQFLNLFFESESIGYIEKRGEKKEGFSSLDEPCLAEIPLVVWVNQATMGPAEAVAAVFKEQKRAKIVGLPTLGLAAELEFFPLEDGTSIVLTSGLFCLRSGERLWGRGAQPDAIIDIRDQGTGAYLNKTQSLFPFPIS